VLVVLVLVLVLMLLLLLLLLVLVLVLVLLVLVLLLLTRGNRWRGRACTRRARSWCCASCAPPSTSFPPRPPFHPVALLCCVLYCVLCFRCLR